jgi:hypothetical protein
MIDRIGIASGKIWSYLNQNEKATINKLAGALDAPERVILMGIGWLAREDKVTFTTEGRFNYVVLNVGESSIAASSTSTK